MPLHVKILGTGALIGHIVAIGLSVMMVIDGPSTLGGACLVLNCIGAGRIAGQLWSRW